jgi:TolA-binding protein
MESKPIKSTNPKIETVISLQQKNRKLQIQIDSLKVKVLKLETKVLKQEQKILRLQAERDPNLGLMQTVVQALRESEHDEPPEK